MDGITNEIRYKIKCAVKAKLQEIGAYVDEELPDYIMVLIANRRSKAQMKSELSLFLGSNTDSFTDWLHSVLERLEAFAISNNTTEKLKEAVSSTPKPGNSISAPLAPHTSASLADQSEPAVSTTTLLAIKKENMNEMSLGQATSFSLSDQSHFTVASTGVVENQALEAMEDDCLNIGDEIEPDFEGNEQATKKVSQITERTLSYNKRFGSNIEERVSKKPRRDENFRRSRRHDGHGQSRLFSVVRPIVSQKKPSMINSRRNDDSKEEEFDEASKSSVNSVVRVTTRRKLPVAMQPTKNLILKAVAEAQKSVIANPPKALEPEEKPMPALYTRKYRERQMQSKMDLPDVKIENLQDAELVHQLMDDEIQHQIIGHESPVREYISPLLRATADHQLSGNYQDENSQLDTEPRMEPRFIVTLDGVHSVVNRHFGNVSFEEDEMEVGDVPDIRNSAKSLHYRRRSTGAEIDVSKTLERCKFWPSCRQGDRCSFYHPKTPCKAFPNCTFGENCLFLHPSCKYDAACSRKSCPFLHTQKSKPPLITSASSAQSQTASVINGKTVCKFFPACSNVSCAFFHPPACKYGTNCTRVGCTFFHSSAFPAKNKLKWVQTSK